MQLQVHFRANVVTPNPSGSQAKSTFFAYISSGALWLLQSWIYARTRTGLETTLLAGFKYRRGTIVTLGIGGAHNFNSQQYEFTGSWRDLLV
jgi:hypothetical protein